MSKAKQYFVVSDTVKESRWLFRYSINKLGEEGLVEHGDFARAIFILRDGTSYRFIGESCEMDKTVGFRGFIIRPTEFAKLIRRKYKCVLEL